MKKILFLLAFASFFGVQAQDKGDKIKALKTAYITEHLQLTPQEAEKFWPVYNKYDQTNHELRKSKKSVYCSINDQNTSAAKAQEMLQEYMQLEERRCNLRKRMLTDLATVLPPQKIIKLKQVEDDFHKKLLEEYRSRKAKSAQ